MKVGKCQVEQVLVVLHPEVRGNLYSSGSKVSQEPQLLARSPSKEETIITLPYTSGGEPHLQHMTRSGLLLSLRALNGLPSLLYIKA